MKLYSALLVTSHCALHRKIVSVHLRVGSVSAERVGQVEVGGVTHRVTCTWWLLGAGFEKAMVGTRSATSHPDCMDRLRNTTLTL